ncbi:MATE family efflux transporter [Vallicoccus soli]|uniref:MATE family efflux transporter n=1 Tax=Vallicoccus soli TaxID=2339232 RepID=A0A3A3YVC3_9ACTN|nr:MATE family efflux transporter [Vallicoccus soli]RJK94174.1 MATE family efflux transporter [Vallicoccus soli]
MPTTPASPRPGAGPARRSAARRLVPRPSPLDAEILRLAVPAFGALVAEPLFVLADTAVVGHLGTPQLAGVAVAGAALTTLVALCVFLAYATTAAVARRVGAGDLAGALRQGVDGLWLAAGLGAGLAVLAAATAGPVVRALGAESAAAGHARTYLLASAPGIPAMLLVLAATGVLRGLQDTRTPLVVAASGAAVNAPLNLLLVHGAGLGVAGSALGTVLVQAAMAATFLRIVVRGARRAGTPLGPSWAGARAAASAGAPLLVRTLTLRAAILLTTWVAARQGDTAVAAHQVAFALWGLLALALDAVAIAGQALVGRHLGAGDVATARAATRRMVGWGAVSGAVLGALVVALRPAYDGWFSPDPAVQALLAGVLLVAAVQQPVAGVVFALDGVLIGAGDGRYLAAAGVVTLVVYAPLALLVAATSAGLSALWWAFGGFMLARLVTLVLRWRSDAWLVTGATRA